VATTIAALALLVSVITAVLAWWQTDRQGKKLAALQTNANRFSSRLADIEEDRRADELRPQFDVGYRNGIVTFRYLGPVEPLDRCVAQFPPDSPGEIHPAIGVATRDEEILSAPGLRLRLMNESDGHHLPLRHERTTNVQRLTMVVEAEGREWRVPVAFTVPGRSSLDAV
jgi:hypothetical protein